MSEFSSVEESKMNVLLDHLIAATHDISRKHFGNPEEIFELTKTQVYPEKISELAESFGMMIVKVEARELRLEQTINRLKELNEELHQENEKRKIIEDELRKHRNNLEITIAERTDQLLKANESLKVEILERQKIADERQKLIEDLTDALKNIKTLRGLVPICASCKKIRDDKGYWNEVETYVSQHSEAEFSHGVCPQCLKKQYPAEYERMQKKGKIESEK